MNKENFYHHVEGKKKMLSAILAVLIVFFVVLIFSTGVDVVNKIKEGKYISQNIRARNSIVIFETGEVYAKPDLAVVVFSVIKEAKTVSGAMNENSAVMNNVIEAIKEQGVEEKDIKTTSFDITPRYEYSEGTFGKRVLVGYEVVQGLEVKIRNMGKIGEIIEKAADSGANDIGDLQLTIDNQDELENQAREKAIGEAKTKADQLASQLGVELGGVISFNESLYFPYYKSQVSLKEAAGGGEIPNIQTGENKISVSVTITYQIY